MKEKRKEKKEKRKEKKSLSLVRYLDPSTSRSRSFSCAHSASRPFD
jgi:cytochrome c peroxidase